MHPPDTDLDTRDDLLWTVSAHSGTAALVAGRYRLEARIGEGGGGEVFRAWDRIEDRPVALKRFRFAGAQAEARVHREVAALRLLDLPGVVRILDDGLHGGRSFIAMELVDGAPFPGAGRAAWAEVEAPTLSLLRTLARVHDIGVVHRDIKPANVLVDAAGRAVVLDFGLARGGAVGSTITQSGALLGTPRYLAPEQLQGEVSGPRADLYAVGVMLYEVLAGRPPFEAEDFESLWRAKLHDTPTPLERLAPDVPAWVVSVVTRLLANRPEDRPPSAARVIELLDEQEVSAARLLPWIGGRGAVQAALDAVEAGGPLDVVGPPGSGRSTVLSEAAAALATRGRPVAWTTRGVRPFESLAPALGAALPAAAGGDMPSAVRGQVAAFLADGGVLLVEDESALDRWSRGLLTLPGRIVAVREQARPDRPAVHLAPWTEEELRPLFHGPERLLHLPTDGAAALVRRTSGLPAAVVAELRAWVGMGLATWDEGRVRLDRTALDRLAGDLQPAPIGPDRAGSIPLDAAQRELLAWVQLAGVNAREELLAQVLSRPAWQLHLELGELEAMGLLLRAPEGRLALAGAARSGAVGSLPGSLHREAHRALALALPAGSPGRLFHVFAGGLTELLADEALATASRCRAAGRVGEAEAVLGEAIRGLRRAGDAVGEARLLGPLVRTAVAVNTVRAVERARYEVDRASMPRPELLDLCDAALAARRGDPDQALASTARIGVLPDPEAEVARHHTRMLAVQGRPEQAPTVIDELRELSQRTADPELQALLTGWEGLVHYRQGRFAEAARLHEQSAAARTQALGRLSARINAANAWLEAGELDRAEAVGRVVLDEARRARATYYELQGEWILRSARASRRDGARPDLELVEAVAALGDPQREGVVCTTEAIIAWQAAEADVAVALARQARDAYGRAGVAHGLLFVDCMLAMVDPAWTGDVEALAARAAACPVPGLGLDSLGMLASRWPLAARWTEEAERLARGHRGSVSRGMLTADEALARIRAVGGVR